MSGSWFDPITRDVLGRRRRVEFNAGRFEPSLQCVPSRFKSTMHCVSYPLTESALIIMARDRHWLKGLVAIQRGFSGALPACQNALAP